MINDIEVNCASNEANDVFLREEKSRICGKMTITEERWYVLPDSMRIYIDRFGRITIPETVRERLCIRHGETMEVFIDRSTIALAKYGPRCVFCDSLDDFIEFKGKRICRECLRDLRNI
ncbi:MAG TPA: hypothetical protein GXX51_02225 [Firmicutes bacterium]|nr:hypothetical protein [Bacillota bacterium]